MIRPEVVHEIFERAHVEEVVGDFVNLKKRGSNLTGLCPFHNEKTPSFSVSPSKGIYKCFGCGKGGNSVNFIMEHEHLSYPEALKFLAKKFNIEVEEVELSPEDKQKADLRESLFIVSEKAMSFFQESMMNTPEGQSIGLSYFQEREVNAAMIDRFALGYCPEAKESSFTGFALAKGYKKEYLLRSGLSKAGQHGLYDFYHGRVIFPIRSISGRTLGFGGRTLKSDKKIAKYFNSPESEIYNKGKVLYGLFESKSAIVKQDLCYMVEGYMDVISMHQSGIENTVSSSGTSLSLDQIRLVRRYTPNVTLVFDSDNAGIKASFRGIDLLLEEGMKVRVVSLPEGEDPDTMAKNQGKEALAEYLKEKSKDFFSFMCDTLLKGSGQDPIQRSQAIQEIIASLGRYQDRIERNLKTQELASRLGIDQQTLLYEIRKAQTNRQKDKQKEQQRAQFSNTPPPIGLDAIPPITEEEVLERDMPSQEALLGSQDHVSQEKDLIRLLVNYGAETLHLPIEVEEGEEAKAPFEESETEEVLLEEYVLEELVHDKYVTFKDGLCSKVWTIYQSAYSEERKVDVQSLLRHPDPEISRGVAGLLSEKHVLHRWHEKKIYPKHEKDSLEDAVDGAINSLRLRTAVSMRKETLTVMRNEKDVEQVMSLQKRKMKLDTLISRLCEASGTVIVNN